MEEKSNLNKVKENDIYVRLQFYEQMDSLMVNLLVDLAINMVRVLYATVRYVLMQPIRLVEYIWYCIQIERECDREETIRFENLKRTGHI